ncbi:MAG: M24 family metallopeptidase [Opitutales bacterium]
MSTKAYCIYNTTEGDLNLLYWGNFSAPDAFFALKLADRTIAFVSELEYSRCQQTSCFNEVYLLSEIRKELRTLCPEKAYWPAFFQFLQKKYKVDQFVVPNDFPAFIYAQIASEVSINFNKDFFETQRAIKTNSEIAEIQKACELTAKGIDFAKNILRQSQIKDQLLYYEGQILTSESLRSRLEAYCLSLGGYATDTIICGGLDASNPHARGKGPLHANELIVIDFFPRLQASHFYGDMTRTVLKGKANAQQEHLYNCVLECQQEIITKICPGVYTNDLMQFALDFFEKAGYGLKTSPNACEGFIHSLGHGLGLDLHEYPSVSHTPVKLQSGMVITIEPGLYFKELGSIRIEDDVLVTPNGYQVLSKCDYSLNLE